MTLVNAEISPRSPSVALLLGARASRRFPDLRRLLAAYGWKAVASNPRHLSRLWRSDSDEFTVIVAVIEPSGSGDAIPWLHATRKAWPAVPLLVIGDCSNVDAVTAWQAVGVDDVIHSSTPLVAIGDRIRRAAKTSRDMQALFSLWDPRVGWVARDRTLWLNGNVVHLSPLETTVLTYLVSRLGHTVTRNALDAAIGHDDAPRSTHSNIADVYVRNLRQKLGMLELNGCIQTVRGVGYRLMSRTER